MIKAFDVRQAAERLDALLHSDGWGHVLGATYYAAETRLHYAVTAERLVDLQDLLDRKVPDAYSLWCADGVERGFATEAEAASSAGWRNP